MSNLRRRNSIVAVKSESPSSSWYKGKSDDDVIFATMPVARWRLRLNNVYNTGHRSFGSSRKHPRLRGARPNRSWRSWGRVASTSRRGPSASRPPSPAEFRRTCPCARRCPSGFSTGRCHLGSFCPGVRRQVEQQVLYTRKRLLIYILFSPNTTLISMFLTERWHCWDFFKDIYSCSNQLISMAFFHGWDLIPC